MALRGVLFDLDDTLFDHNHATACATSALRETEPVFAIWSADELRRRHSELLEVIHVEVVAGRLGIDDARRERFRRLVAAAGGDDEALGRAVELARAYRHSYEQNWRPVDGALDLLRALKSRDVRIGIVTNNLTREQEMKLQQCLLAEHVDALVTSEATGCAKPNPAIFEAALDALAISNVEAVMVGDAWDMDIAGALEAGVRPVWFNWRRQEERSVKVREIQSLAPVDVALHAIVG